MIKPNSLPKNGKIALRSGEIVAALLRPGTGWN